MDGVGGKGWAIGRLGADVGLRCGGAKLERLLYICWSPSPSVTMAERTTCKGK